MLTPYWRAGSTATRAAFIIATGPAAPGLSTIKAGGPDRPACRAAPGSRCIRGEIETRGAGMNVIEKRGAAAKVADLDRFRLRRFIDDLAGSDELERRAAPVDLADIAKILDDNVRAVHFLAAGPERQELVGNVVSSRSRIARAFGLSPEQLAAEIARRLAN